MPRRGGLSAVVSPPPEPRFAPNGYRLPDPIREGEILTDVTKKQWKLGRSIGLGGFGEIYLGMLSQMAPFVVVVYFQYLLSINL